MEKHVYKIIPGDTWRDAVSQEALPPLPLDAADGFIHLSTTAQVAGTLARHFSGQSDLFLLQIETAKLEAAALKWEPAQSGDTYPHYYASLPMDAVADVFPVYADANGSHHIHGWNK